MTSIETSVLIKLVCAKDYLPRGQVGANRSVANHRIHRLRSKGIPIKTIFAKPHKRGKQVLGYRLEDSRMNSDWESDLTKFHGTSDCHICGKPRAGKGSPYCSYPHGMVPDKAVSADNPEGFWIWKSPKLEEDSDHTNEPSTIGSVAS